MIKEHFDKFLLAFLVLFFTALGWHAIFFLTRSHTPADPAIVQFMGVMFDNQKLVIGALLGLITGQALRQLQAKNGSTPPSVTPIVPPPVDTPKP